MAKKKDKKIDDIFENAEIEPVEGKASETEPVLDESDAIASSEADLQNDEAFDLEEVDETLDEEEEISVDALLDDVRRSLIEEDVRVEEEKKPSWWQRFGSGRQKANKSDEGASDVEAETDLQPSVSEDDIEPIIEPLESADESIDDLIEMLATDADDEELLSDADNSPADIQMEIKDEQPEIEIEKIDVDEQKKRAFQTRPDDEEENFSDVRAVALDDGEEVFVEVEVQASDPVEDRVKAFENALRPYRTYINLGIAFIGIVAIVAVAGLLFGVYRDSQPQVPTPTPSNLPYPVTLIIVDGGFSFELGRGSLEDGRWNPRRPEWLEGTEVCRWVAIIYTRPLEAALRTLTQNDQLELVMSNGDIITYDVYSITQMSIEDMQKVSSNSPCLLVVLADANTDTRLVVTAYP